MRPTFILDGEWLALGPKISRHGEKFQELVVCFNDDNHRAFQREFSGNSASRTFMVWIKSHDQMYLLVDSALMNLGETTGFYPELKFWCREIQVVPCRIGIDGLVMWR
jgi:hypothetical protein